MFGSYNKFNNNVLRDSIFVSSLDFLTSVMASLSIFAVLGALQHDLNLDDIKDVAKGGKFLLHFNRYSSSAPEKSESVGFLGQIYLLLSNPALATASKIIMKKLLFLHGIHSLAIDGKICLYCA